MTRRLCWLVLTMAATCLAVPALAAGLLDQAKSMSNPLGSMLESQLGVTQDQAAGGIGSILSLARDRLDAGDFDSLAKSIPGAGEYMDKARELGAVNGSLSSLADLNGALARLGIPPEVAARFAPTVTDLVTKVGGEEAGRMLAAVLSGG